MTTAVDDHESLVTYLLVDRQVYEARRWAREWLVLTGVALLAMGAWVLFVCRGLGLSEAAGVIVIVVAGATLARRDYVAAHRLIRIKCEYLAHRFEYLRDLSERFLGGGAPAPRPRWMRYAWPLVYAALKMRLAVLLLLALMVQVVDGAGPLARAEAARFFYDAGTDARILHALGSCGLALAFLYLADGVIERRRRRFDRVMERYARDSGVSLELREKVTIALVRELNGRF